MIGVREEKLARELGEIVNKNHDNASNPWVYNGVWHPVRNPSRCISPPLPPRPYCVLFCRHGCFVSYPPSITATLVQPQSHHPHFAPFGLT